MKKVRQSKTPENPAAETQLRVVTYAAVIAILTIVIYHNCFLGQFVFDDRGPSILHNPSFRGSSNLLKALQPPSDATVTSRPLLNLTFAFNYYLEGTKSNILYHLGNLLIHVFNGILLFAFIRHTLNGPRMRTRYGKYSMELAFVCGLVWVSHPLCTSSVTYIVQRAESLMSLFLLLTLYCCVRADKPELNRGPWTVGAIFFCALGMASKEVMAVAPILVICYDWVFRDTDLQTSRHERGSLYVGLGITWLVLLVAMSTGSRSAVQFGHVHDVTSLDYAKTQMPILVHYLRLVLWPQPLVFDYDWPIVRHTQQWLPYAPVIILLGFGSLVALVKRWSIGFPGTLFFLLLGPSSSFLIIYKEVASEHRMYLPAAAVIVICILGMWNLGQLVVTRCGIAPHLGSKFGWLAVVGIVTFFSVLTFQRNFVFHTRLGLWKTTAEHAPRGARPQYNLGLQYRRVANELRTERDKLRRGGKLTEADEKDVEAERYTTLQMEQFNKALAIKPDYPNVHYSVGVEMQRLEKDDLAMEAFKSSIAVKYFRERNSRPHNNLGLLFAKQGNYAEALRCYRVALSIDAGNLSARMNLAEALKNTGKYAEAKKELETILSVRSNKTIKALLRYVEILAMAPDKNVRDGPTAIKTMEKILENSKKQSQQTDPSHLELIAAALAETGNYREAAKIVQELENVYRKNGIERHKQMRQRKIAYRSRRPFYLKPQSESEP